ncbi:hypothetical protein, partial [Aporhodopirellula aestuarii]
SECLPPTIVSPALAKQPNPNTKQVCRNHLAKLPRTEGRTEALRVPAFTCSVVPELRRLRLLGPAYAEPITISGIVVIQNLFYLPA